MVMNNSLWTTYSQSLNNFEFSHFCRFFPILFDSYRHSLLNRRFAFKVMRGFMFKVGSLFKSINKKLSKVPCSKHRLEKSKARLYLLYVQSAPGKARQFECLQV